MAHRRLHRLIQSLVIFGVLFLIYQMYALNQLQETTVRSRRRKPLPDLPPVSSRGHKTPVGVAARWAHLYWEETSDHFSCGDSLRVLPWTKVNDDFCDCGHGEDVGDEPSTGACLDTFFTCSYDPNVQVPASRVNDGLCDCCDGSDEPKDVPLPAFARLSTSRQKSLGVYQTPCINRCQL
ncbi:uncharacterized protein LOC100903904 [Galendromus occidentalis]|uniref:Uncharacterized protein LOC100903904 n=1 Tax=Galendromus occidentalis TaxID=34638 RepID=A0AAJ6VZN5_9ACAR|nr:uncharacterized protein LOC100903904 [Galendromus occidentalis]